MEDNLLNELKSKYGEVYCLSGEVEDGVTENYYFRKPERKDISRFAQEVSKDILKATNNFVFGCLVHPDPEVLRKKVDERPGIIIPLGAELQKIVGSNVDFLSSRL